jgi:hypothetical protein
MFSFSFSFLSSYLKVGLGRELFHAFKEKFEISAPRREVQAAAAAGLVVTMATSIVFFQKLQHGRRQLASAQVELLSARGLASSPEVYVLGLSRGSSEAKEIALPREPRWMVFSIEMDTTQFPGYRAVLTDPSGKEIWQQAGIQPASPDAIGVAVPSNLLAPGSYALIIQPSIQAGATLRFSRTFPIGEKIR